MSKTDQLISHLDTTAFVSPSQYGLPRSSAELELSAVDMHMPRLYGTRWILCFPLTVEAEMTQIYEKLKLGLAHTISSAPWLAGNIGPQEGRDPKQNRIQIFDSSKGVHFVFKDLTDVMPSYAVLQAEHFPLSKLDPAHLSPLGLMPNTKDASVMAAQANFIRGGLLLAVGVHHSASDASAVGAILDIWAQNTAAAYDSHKFRFTQFEPQHCDRSTLMTGSSGAKVEDFPAYFFQAAASKAPEKGKSYQIPRAPLQLPPMVSYIFRFSPESLATLKVDAAAYSTNDALTAFLWRHMTLARNPVFRAEAEPSGDVAEKASAVLYAVNIRSRTSPPLPQNYLGNAFLPVKTDHLSISTLTSPSGLKIGTSAIRKPLQQLADEPNRISLNVGLLDQLSTAELKYAYNGFLGPDVRATSWADLGVYNSVWGELGTVESFRVPGEGSDGSVAVFPRLPDGGVEVMVGLEAGAMERLIENSEFIAKAELWA